jgi:hypothetical protein
MEDGYWVMLNPVPPLTEQHDKAICGAEFDRNKEFLLYNHMRTAAGSFYS